MGSLRAKWISAAAGSLAENPAPSLEVGNWPCPLSFIHVPLSVLIFQMGITASMRGTEGAGTLAAQSDGIQGERQLCLAHGKLSVMRTSRLFVITCLFCPFSS